LTGCLSVRRREEEGPEDMHEISFAGELEDEFF